jgi:hypothetical protein
MEQPGGRHAVVFVTNSSRAVVWLYGGESNTRTLE